MRSGWYEEWLWILRGEAVEAPITSPLGQRGDDRIATAVSCSPVEAPPRGGERGSPTTMMGCGEGGVHGVPPPPTPRAWLARDGYVTPRTGCCEGATGDAAAAATAYFLFTTCAPVTDNELRTTTVPFRRLGGVPIHAPSQSEQQRTNSPCAWATWPSLAQKEMLCERARMMRQSCRGVETHHRHQMTIHTPAQAQRPEGLRLSRCGPSAGAGFRSPPHVASSAGAKAGHPSRRVYRAANRRRPAALLP